MALQSSGAISYADIQAEMDHPSPMGMDDLHGIVIAVAPSGILSLNEFYEVDGNVLDDSIVVTSFTYIEYNNGWST